MTDDLRIISRSQFRWANGDRSKRREVNRHHGVIDALDGAAEPDAELGKAEQRAGHAAWTTARMPLNGYTIGPNQGSPVQQ